MPRPILVLCVAFALFASDRVVARPIETAPDPAEAKIRLLSDALRARDRGDLVEARAKLEALLKLAPGDATVTRLLATLAQPAETKVTVSGGVAAAPSEADALAREEAERLERALAAARESLRAARAEAAERQFVTALDRLSQARRALPENPATQATLAEIDAAVAKIVGARDARETAAASAAAKSAPEDTPAPERPEAGFSREEPRVASTDLRPPVPASAELRELIARGRSQYLAGDPSAAAQTFARVLELDPGNADATRFLRRIADDTIDHNLDRTRTSAQLLNEVARGWQRPAVAEEPAAGAGDQRGTSPVLEKLNAIVLPEVNFSGMELGRVMTFLGAASAEYDASNAPAKGVNIVLLDPSGANPLVRDVTLRNLPLKRVLDLVTQAVGYQYEVQADAVVVRPGGEQTTLDTQFFPVSRSTVLRMTGRGGDASAGGPADPLAGGARSAGATAPSTEGGGQAIRNFLQLAGVSFDGTPGSTLAFDGSQLIVTQTSRNLERVRNILTRYSDVRQVEIEAKFMEVQDGALEELGVNWSVGKKATQHSGASVTNYATSNRSLESAFSNNVSATQGLISRPSAAAVYRDNNGNGVFDDGDTLVSEPTDGINLPIPSGAPAIPGTNNLGRGANPLAAVTGILGEFNVNAVIRALSQRSGTELLSAPKLTVLSGNPATITVAQELRYPQSYGQVQSQVGTGSASGGGSAGVTITAGTPQEFATRNIGVELRVTPTVEEDDHSISLDLNPKVTEFEGFVEYGGQSVAVSGSTTVTVPSGFYQPIFAVRELTTKVTIWDGATLVMGGLTREDTRKTNDKVPLIGNVPVLGRLFRSNGESAQKRNLLIFVTANLVSPGGSLKKQNVRGAPAKSIFENPTIVTPAGAGARGAKK